LSTSSPSPSNAGTNRYIQCQPINKELPLTVRWQPCQQAGNSDKTARTLLLSYPHRPRAKLRDNEVVDRTWSQSSLQGQLPANRPLLRLPRRKVKMFRPASGPRSEFIGGGRLRTDSSLLCSQGEPFEHHSQTARKERYASSLLS